MADSQVKTANLFNYSDLEEGAISVVTGEDVPNTDLERTQGYIVVEPNTTYTLSNYNDKVRLFLYSNDAYIGNELSTETPYTFTTDSTCRKIRIMGLNGNFLETTMLNVGSTALPYWQHSLRKLTTATEAVENPLYSDGTAITAYTIKGNTVQNGTPTPDNPVDVVGVGTLDSGQYKIPISSGGVTTNIYLTEQLMKIDNTADSLVSTGVVTYNIKKYVFTGDETFSEYGQSTSQADAYRFATSTAVASDISSSLYTSSICTHFTYNKNWNKIGFSFNGGKIYMTTNTAIDATSLKQWLAEQYSAGTPVTVYYVLGTPTTETVTAPSIPTTEGANSITVDTTVQPSEFTATWTGWHDSSVKEWDGSQWNE